MAKKDFVDYFIIAVFIITLLMILGTIVGFILGFQWISERIDFLIGFS